MLVDAIYRAANAEAARRKLPRIGAHNVGQCVRRLWYIAHQEAGESLDGRALLLFDLGDRIEDSVLHFLALTEIPFIRTERREDTVRLVEHDIGVRSDFCAEIGGEIVGGEIKSMSNFAFARAQRGVLDDAYLAQVECGLRAYGWAAWVVVCYRKETSHLHELWVRPSQARWAAIQDKLATARSDVLPPRPYRLDARCAGCAGGGQTPTGRAHKHCAGTGLEPGGPFLPTFPCGYCAYMHACWGAVALVMRKGKPRFRSLDAKGGEGEMKAKKKKGGGKGC